MALSLTWSYGFDKDLVGGVQSLGEGGSERKSIFFVSGTTGVIFTHDGEGNKTQTLLQGHVNAITGVVISTDKKRIVTADKGKDSLLVVWDSETATPVKTIYRPHPT
ncbi:coiled-coil protein, partial [Toxoplasma gondii RUB]